MKATYSVPRTNNHLQYSIAPPHWRIWTVLILASGCLAVPHRADAACPEICDVSTENTGVGDSALVSLTTGGGNTAVGRSALEQNTTGIQNTATGSFALQSNRGSTENTATGAFA